MNVTYFDVETQARPEQELLPLMPVFAAPSNYKDEAKIDEYIGAKKAAWIQQAALDPMTGKILCIGLLYNDGTFTVQDGGGSEAQLLTDFWNLFSLVAESASKSHMAGWCSSTFDLPFMVRRSWLLSVPVPRRLRDSSPSGRSDWSQVMIDVQKIWTFGRTDEGSLGQVAKFLGVGEKTGNGADFAALYHSNKPAALAYLKNDLEITKAIHKRLQYG